MNRIVYSGECSLSLEKSTSVAHKTFVSLSLVQMLCHSHILCFSSLRPAFVQVCIYIYVHIYKYMCTVVCISI